MRLLFLLLVALWGAGPARAGAVQDPEARMALVPWPTQVFFTEDAEFELFSGMRIVAEDTSLMPLARLLAENPYGQEQAPWTYQRLKKKFEDKDKPGLWDRENKTYSVVRKQGGAVGFINENTSDNQMFWCELHVGNGLSDRDALGADLVAAYLAYKERWHRPRRISFALLLVEEQKTQWLTAAGFEQELVFERAYFHQGQATALAYYTWCADWALARRAEQHPVPGEEDPRRGN